MVRETISCVYLLKTLTTSASVVKLLGRSHWPRGLKRVSGAVSWLGLRVRIPVGDGRHGCLSIVNIVCCQVEVSATG